MNDGSQSTVRQLEDRRYRAMCEGDTATLKELLADTLVYTHSNGAADGKASYLAGVGVKWKYRKVERPVEDIAVYGTAEGQCAVVTGQVRIDVVIDGVAKILNSRYTDVWVKNARGWQMVAWQSTPAPA
jgi:ketosteroid isomerase-like protein